MLVRKYVRMYVCMYVCMCLSQRRAYSKHESPSGGAILPQITQV